MNMAKVITDREAVSDISQERGVFYIYWFTVNLFFSVLRHHYKGLPHSSVGKESACNAEDPGSISGSGRSPREGNGNPLQYSCLEKPKDRGTWQIPVHGVARVGHDLVTKPPPPQTRL